MLNQPFIIYSKKDCKWCENAKGLLDKLGVEYKTTIIGEGISRDDFVAMLPEQFRARPTAPQIYDANNNRIGTYEDLVEYVDNRLTKD